MVLTGGFDINLTIPSDETIGQGFAIDWNVISANILAGDDVAWVSSDANKAVELDGLDANVVVFPTIIHTEAQLQVSVSGSTYDLNYAMRDGNISNFEAISGITLTSLTNAGDVKIAFSDINLLGYTTELSAPYIDIDTNFSAEEGILEFETDPGELTMFNVDSNITFYDVLSPGAMPVLLKNGKLCSSTDCKNWDGTSVINDSTDASGNITWANNGTDGNLLFNVPGFSIYSTSLLSATIVSPNGDSNSLRQTDADGNALIIFTYYDLNETVTDNGPTVNLHYSDTNGGMQGIIITDANVHDNEIITCTNEDSNYATVNTCVYAWDLNGIGPGEFWVDLNIIDFDDTGRVKWMYDHSDANFLVNAPVIEFIDDSIFVEYPTAEQNGGSFLNPEYTQPFSADGNLWMRIDFNVFFPNDQNSMYDLNNLQIVFDHDTNALNGYDGNFVDGNYLVDANAYGVAFAPNLGQVSSVDLNLGEICSYCAGGDANAQIDMNCHFNVNMGEADDGGSIQGTLKGIWYLRIDANYGSIYSPYKVAIGTTRPEANPVTGNTEGTYINKIYNLDFNVSDPDWFDYNKMDGNFLFADFYLDSDSNYWNGAGTLVINDLNLATSGTCTQDLNWADSNSAIDNNCLYAWDTTALTDGNYYLHIDLNEGAAGNYTSDFNTTLTSFVIDNTVPIVSITSGTGSQATDSPTITWAASDATAGIETIYVTIDSGTPVTLGRAETSYSFSGLGTGNHYVDVNVVDLAGNSADASAQINVTTGGTTTTTTTGSTGGPTGGTGTTEPTTSTISTGTITTETTTEQITSVLTEAGLSTTAIEGAIGALEKIIAETGYKVEKTVQKGKTTIYATTITNTITNSTDNVLTNVKVYAEIPKTIASNASEISSAQAFTIIKADPILLFTIDQIAAGSSATIKYTVNKNVAEADLKAMTQPIVAEFTEVQPDLCEGIECNDNNPCTSDSCLNGECSYSKLADKTACGTNKECKNGVCITKTTTPTGQAAPKTTEPVSGAFDFTTIIIVIIFIVIIIIAFAVMRQRKTGLRK